MRPELPFAVRVFLTALMGSAVIIALALLIFPAHGS